MENSEVQNQKANKALKIIRWIGFIPGIFISSILITIFFNYFYQLISFFEMFSRYGGGVSSFIIKYFIALGSSYFATIEMV